MSLNGQSPALLSRRNILRGTGVCVALPFLESLLPNARAQVNSYPKRFLPIFFPNGVPTQWWTQAGTPGSGDSWTLSSVLQPLLPFKSKLSILEGMGNYRYHNTQADMPQPAQGRLTTAFLTSADIGSTGSPIAPEFSADQLVAQSFLNQTPLASLQIGFGTADSSCDGYPCEFSRSISWANSQPLPGEIDPRAIFDAIFLNLPSPGNAEETTRQRALNQSVLDYTIESATALQGRLAATDREKVDQFLTAVRDVEMRLNTQPNGTTCATLDRPTFAPARGLANGDEGYNREEHVAIMTDLMVLALQCDATRVISTMLDDARSDFSYSHVTLGDFGSTSEFQSTLEASYYGITHGAPDNNAWCSINHWFNQKVATLCQRLDEIQEGEHTLLDNSVVFFSSNYGSLSGPDRIPVVLLGGAGGTLKTGQWWQLPASPDDFQFRDLHFTLLNQCFSLGLTNFGSDIENRPPRLMTELLV
jgi:hypothetical protein